MLWVLRIPLTFGEVTGEVDYALTTSSVPTGNFQLEESYSTAMTSNSTEDQGAAADQSAGTLVSEDSTGDDRGAVPGLRRYRPRVDSVRHNGSIVSVQMILLLLAWSSSTTLAALLSPDFKPLIGMLTLIVYMIVGLAVMGLFLNLRRRLVASGVDDESPDATDRDSLTLIGIVVFYVFVCILDMFHIAASVDCREVWLSCSNRDIQLSFAVELIFHVARIAYLGLTTAFCFAFHGSTFKDEVPTRYALMFLQAVNISLWFDALIQESAELSGGQWRRMDAYSQNCRVNGSDVSNEVLQCLAHNNTIYGQTESIVTTVCLPFTIEFTLLVGELLGFCFYHCDSGQARPCKKQLTNGHPTESLQRDHASSGADLRGLESEVALPNETSFLLSHTTLTADDLHGSSSSANLFIQLWIAFVIVINVLNCVLTILCKFSINHVAFYKNFSIYFLSTFWIGIIIAVLAGYYVTRSFPVRVHHHHPTRRSSSFSSMDYLLIFTSFGPLAYNAFTCIAANGHVPVVDDDSIHVTTSFYVTLQAFNAVHIHLQTTFSLFAARITVGETQRGTSQARFFRAIIFYLAVSNASLWLTGTIGGYEFGGLQVGEGQSLQAAYFGGAAWAVIYNIVVPLLLFYRFNSCLVFTRIYRRLRVNGNL